MKRSAGVLGDDHVKPVQVQINLALLQGGQEALLEQQTEVGKQVITVDDTEETH